MERKTETKLVKAELAKFGINAIVGHGRGTAWGWLEMNIGGGQQFGEGAQSRQIIHHIARFAVHRAQEVTGRTGGYDGRIMCLTQNHWTKAKGTCPIEHDVELMIQSIPGLAGLLTE